MLIIPKFKMENIEKISQDIRVCLWGSSVNITDAYLHVLLHWNFHKYFAFVLGERVFVFQKLPFGLSTAPWAFTRVIRPIKSQLHCQGVMVYSYLDDFLTLASSPHLLSLHTGFLTSLLQELGFAINWTKSTL